MMTLIHLSESPDSEIARQSLGGLANLAEDVDTHEYIAKVAFLLLLLFNFT
jgi:hypothetical protein